ncbi:flapper isoform 2-T3 [Cochliomyia hominivorax]
MKTTKFLPSPPSPFRGALNMRNIYLTILCLIIATLWNTHSVSSAPAKTDLQPPIFEASASASSPSSSHVNGKSDGTTIDSYGNPIESLQPIETPDGRKVVSAQGLQFEIPNYASGITELKKPADDLLPPFVDPIVVALPNESSETYNAGPFSSTKKTSVHVENIPLVEVKSNFDSSPNSKAGLPDYILELNDPDIAGPVDYEPAEDNRGLKVIAWDLLPPFKAQEIEADKSISHSNKVSVNSGHNFNTQTSQASSHTTHWSQFGLRNSFESTTTTSTTPRITTTRRSTTTTTTTPKTTTTPRTTTTTTPRPTTTTTRRTTTTTRRTTTPLFTTPRTTTAEPDPSEFFKLEAGDSYTLPPWLQDIDDPELDVAVAYIVPEDINEYNQTIDRDILPPLEPYTDLKNVHLTQPPTTTPRTSTTRRITVPTTSRTTLTTTTTTKRPTVSTYQPHWIRAKVTTVKPTIATFNNQFTSFSPSISSFNSAQRTTSTTTTTTTTTVKPKTTTNYYNRGLSTTTSPTDKFGTSSEEVVTKQRNPFLPSFNDGKYRPQSTTRRTTTTTTTTPAPEIVEENPFEPTIPPYLRDFDYPDLGAGVPFVYDPNEDENPVDKNILPPSKTEDTITKSNSEPSSNSPFSNSQKPQGFTNKFSTSTISLASSSSIPSIVTIPLPSTQTNQADNTVTRPPPVFVPPPPTKADDIIIADNADDITKKTSSTFNKHFAAPFEPTTTAASSSLTTSATTALGADVKKVPLSADRESFPPFNNIITGSSTLPSKTTFTKSEDGKVITNNIFLSGSIGSTSAKPIGSSFGLSNPEKNTFSTQSFTGSSVTKSTTASSVFKQFGSTSSGVTGFVTTADSLNDGSKYTGRFGGPPGVLAPQNSGFTTSSTTVTKTYNKPAFTTFGITSSPGFATNNKDKFTGSFGGPPGILKPYDNVKNR